MDKKTIDSIFNIFSYIAIMMGVLLVVILVASLSQKSGGQYIEVWAKDNAPLIAALGVLIASGLASLSAHRAIYNSVQIENQKRKYQSSLDVEDIVSNLMSIDMSAKYFGDVFSEDFVNAYKRDPLKTKEIVLSLFNSLNTSVATELNNLWQVRIPKEIDAKYRGELRAAIFQTRNVLRKISLITELGIATKDVREDQLETIQELLVNIREHTIISPHKTVENSSPK